MIPEANVLIHNEQTGVDTPTTTTHLGTYTVPYLKPGNYNITVTKQVFKTEQKTAIALVTDQTSTIDFQMAIGSTQEVVTVNASGLQVELPKADRSELIEAERVQQLPIDSRNAYNLVALSPGVHDFSTPQYDRQFDNVTGNSMPTARHRSVRPALTVWAMTRATSAVPPTRRRSMQFRSSRSF